VVHAFAEALAERVDGASCMMLATLSRVSLTLGDITKLTEGMVLPLWNASIDRIRLEGLDGRILGEGQLGQNRGMRAVRLAERPAAKGRGAAAAPVQVVAAASAAVGPAGAVVSVPGGDKVPEPARAAV
jgi:flagellar motor switch protein FliM